MNSIQYLISRKAAFHAFRALMVLLWLTGGAFGGGNTEADLPGQVRIRIQPQGSLLYTGAVLNLSVDAAGGDLLSYQWMRNGLEIAGGTGSSYAIASVTDLEEGDYTVRVGNAAGSVTSEAAAVRVAFDLGSIVGGGNGRGRVLAGNEGKNGINSSSGSFTAGSNMGHTYYSGYKAVPGSPFIDGVFNLGSNRVNSRGVVYSLQTGDGSHASFDYLSNNREPGGSRALEFQGKKYGSGIGMHGGAGMTFKLSEFRVSGGSTALSFHGEYGTMGTGKVRGYVVLSDGVRVLSELVTPVMTRENGAYVISMNVPEEAEYLTLMSGVGGDGIADDHAGFGDARIEARRVEWRMNPVWVRERVVGGTYAAGSNISLQVGAGGDGPLSYQWRKGGVDIVGATGERFVVESASGADAGEYSVVVRNEKSVAVSGARVVVNTPLSIREHPVARMVNPGSEVRFAVVAEGSGTWEYQWKKGEHNIVGATGPVYTVARSTEADEGLYSVVVSNSEGRVQSTVAELKVNDPLVILSQPLGVGAMVGASAVLRVTASGEGPVNYQWRKNGEALAGATEADYAIPFLSKADAGIYSVVVSDSVNRVLSEDARVLVFEPVRILSQSIDQRVRVGGALNLDVAVSGEAPVRFQWKKNGVSIPGANAASYSVASASKVDEGRYEVMVTNPVGEVQSDPVNVSVSEPLNIVESPASKTVMVGGAIVFHVKASGDGPLRYRWKRGTHTIVESGSDRLEIESASEADAGEYSVEVSNEIETVASETAFLSIDHPPTVTLDTFETNSAGLSGAMAFGGSTGSGKGIDRVEVTLNEGLTRLAAVRVRPGQDHLWTWSFTAVRDRDGLRVGENTLGVVAYDRSGNASERLKQTFTVNGPVSEFAGVFSGLLAPPLRASLDPLSHGLLSVSISKRGAFSGRLRLREQTHGFTGQLDELGRGLFARSKSTRLPIFIREKGVQMNLGNLELQVANAESGPVVKCRILAEQDPELLASEGTAHEVIYHRASESQGEAVVLPRDLFDPDYEKGRYNASLELPEEFRGSVDPETGRERYPSGYGSVRMTLLPHGSVLWSGRLADRTLMTFSGRLTGGRHFPVFVPLYSKKGLLLGEVEFDAGAEASDAEGRGVRWFKPADENALIYPDGWPQGLDVSLVASKYVAPSGAEAERRPIEIFLPRAEATVVDRLDLTLLVSGGGLAGEVEYACSLEKDKKISFAGRALEDKVRCDFSMLAGSFTGSFVNPSTQQTVRMIGMVLQKQGVARGYFMSSPTDPTDPAGRWSAGSVEIHFAR
jgi:hypothetical protein